MKKDLNHIINSNEDKKVSFEELHIRHLNLLIDLRSEKLNNWFLKMAIINTFEDLKIFLNNLKNNNYQKTNQQEIWLSKRVPPNRISSLMINWSNKFVVIALLTISAIALSKQAWA